MRKLIAGFLVASALIGTALAGGYGVDNEGLYQAVVCSTFLNNTSTGGYRLLSLPSGYSYFRMIRVIPVAPHAAQTLCLRFWPSTTDSAGGIVTVALAQTSQGEAFNQYFPIRCKAVSVSLIDGTDDFTVECYASKK